MNWYIGQEIVCIKDHSKKAVVVGQTFIIQSLARAACPCHHVQIDIGKKSDADNLGCRKCGVSTRITNGIWWFDEKLFAPLDTLADISELTEHLETTEPFEV